MERPTPSNPATEGEQGRRRKSKRPYTAMFLNMLKLGFTTSDLRSYSLSQVLVFMDEYNLMMSSDEGEEENTRQATQSDIDALLA